MATKKKAAKTAAKKSGGKRAGGGGAGSAGSLDSRVSALERKVGKLMRLIGPGGTGVTGREDGL